jgi:retron-type reverse transcriptase
MFDKKICYSDVWDIDFLKKSFALLRSYQSFRVGGFLKEMFPNEKLIILSKSLEVQKYQPKQSKKVNIPQVKGETRYLSLVSTLDKIVQRRILELLAPVVELLFYKESFGFRSKRGSHDALNYVKSYWSNVTWVIKVNINKYFDRLNYKVLLTKLHDYMDQSSVELVGKFCGFGYLRESFQTFEQTLQRSFISPLLCNIYLHGFDKFVRTNLVCMYNKKNIRAMPFKHQQTNSVNLKNSKWLHVHCRSKNSWGNYRHNLLLDKNIFWACRYNSSFSHLYYVRYIANFMLGYNGARLQANEIYQTVVIYMSNNLKLVLHVDEVSVVHGIQSVKYLGTLIRWENFFNEKCTKKFIPASRFRTVLWNEPRLRFPVEDFFKRILLKRYGVRRITRSKIVRATLFRNISSKSLFFVVQSFNWTIRNILNYYSFVSFRSKLWKIIDLYRKSCAVTLSAKLKLRAVAQVFQKYGRFLTIKNNLSQIVTYLDAWPYNLKTKGKFNMNDFKTNFCSLIKRIDSYSTCSLSI